MPRLVIHVGRDGRVRVDDAGRKTGSFILKDEGKEFSAGSSGHFEAFYDLRISYSLEVKGDISGKIDVLGGSDGSDNIDDMDELTSAERQRIRSAAETAVRRYLESREFEDHALMHVLERL